ncbi:hypothetical protein C0992_007565 [Termitomyces sp. T32_za158]|nr:hypothetical protein C0992_007565 [Termitomyces sp. T32_za158]
MTDPFRVRTQGSSLPSGSGDPAPVFAPKGFSSPSGFVRDVPPHFSTFPSSSSNSTLVSDAYNPLLKHPRNFCPRFPSTLAHASFPYSPTPFSSTSHPANFNRLHAPAPVHPTQPPPIPDRPTTVPARPVLIPIAHDLHSRLPSTPLNPLVTRPSSLASPIAPSPVLNHPHVHGFHGMPQPDPVFPHDDPHLIHLTPKHPVYYPAPPQSPRLPTFQLPPQPVSVLNQPYYYQQPILHHAMGDTRFRNPPPAHGPAVHSSDGLADLIKLPPLLTIPRFMSSADWGLWYNPAMALIDHLGLNGHVCPIPPVGALYDLTCKVVVPPPYPPHQSIDDERAYKIFWRNDNVCMYVLTGRLAAEICNSLPPARGGSYNFPSRTAWDVLSFLRKRFSVGSAASAQAIKNTVFKLECLPTGIPSYVQAW